MYNLIIGEEISKCSRRGIKSRIIDRKLGREGLKFGNLY